jgi:hypothetical protein
MQEFVITSKDPQFNKGLMTALSGADNLIGVHGLKSIFERVYHTDSEAVAVIRKGSEREARDRLARAEHSRIPYRDEVGLQMFIREVKENGETNNKVPRD